MAAWLEGLAMGARVQDMEGFENLTAARLTAALGGDRELLVEIIELYLRDAPSMLQSLRGDPPRTRARSGARRPRVEGQLSELSLTD
jgi:hypothetical protein